MRVQLQRQADDLTNQMKQLENQLEDLELERQAGQLEQALFALAKGGAGRAIALLADAERSNVSPAVVKPRLIDLYCNTGQPDKALELSPSGRLTTRTSVPSRARARLRQGRVYFLLGNYMSAATLWRDRAIPRVRFERSSRAIAAGTVLTTRADRPGGQHVPDAPGNAEPASKLGVRPGDVRPRSRSARRSGDPLHQGPHPGPRPGGPTDRRLLPRENGQARSRRIQEHAVAQTAKARSRRRQNRAESRASSPRQASPTIGLPIAPGDAKPPLTQTGASKETAKSDSPAKPAAAPGKRAKSVRWHRLVEKNDLSIWQTDVRNIVAGGTPASLQTTNHSPLFPAPDRRANARTPGRR